MPRIELKFHAQISPGEDSRAAAPLPLLVSRLTTVQGPAPIMLGVMDDALSIALGHTFAPCPRVHCWQNERFPRQAHSRLPLQTERSSARRREGVNKPDRLLQRKPTQGFQSVQGMTWRFLRCILLDSMRPPHSFLAHKSCLFYQRRAIQKQEGNAWEL